MMHRSKNILARCAREPVYSRWPAGTTLADVERTRRAFFESLQAPPGSAVLDIGSTVWRLPTPEEEAQMRVTFGAQSCHCGAHAFRPSERPPFSDNS